MKRINILSSVVNVFIVIGLLMCMISDGETYCNLDVSNALFLRDRIDRSKDVIPNAETANKLAVEFMDRMTEEEGGALGWGEKSDYELKEIIFDVRNYEWKVKYEITAPDGGVVIDGGKTVWIRRDTGEVVGYAWR